MVMRSFEARSRSTQRSSRFSVIATCARFRRTILWMLSLAVAAAATAEAERSIAVPDATPAMHNDDVSVALDHGKRGNLLRAVSLESLSSTRDRPLFSPQRRPVPPRLPEIAAPPSTILPPRELDHPGIVLAGTVVGAATDIALLLEEKTKAVFRVRPGEAHNGWAVRVIGRREVTLEKEGRIEILALSVSGADALRSGPIQYAEHQPAAILRFAAPMPTPNPGLRCPSGAAALSGDSALCALGRGRAQLIRSDSDAIACRPATTRIRGRR